MNTQIAHTSKQFREVEIRDDIKLKREEFMLERARSIVKAEGLNALTLPRLAQVSEYSKPTVYKYFPTREDLIVALAVQSAAVRASYYERALTFNGRPREKLMAIHSLNTGVLADYFSDMLNVHLNRLSSRASNVRRKQLLKHEDRIAEIHAEIAREALDNGDLILPEGTDEYQILMALTATTFGFHVMQESDSPVVKRWFKGAGFSENNFFHVVLDGLGWRPLSSEWDYSLSLMRLQDEVFPEVHDMTIAAHRSQGP